MLMSIMRPIFLTIFRKLRLWSNTFSWILGQIQELFTLLSTSLVSHRFPTLTLTLNPTLPLNLNPTLPLTHEKPNKRESVFGELCLIVSHFFSHLQISFTKIKIPYRVLTSWYAIIYQSLKPYYSWNKPKSVDAKCKIPKFTRCGCEVTDIIVSNIDKAEAEWTLNIAGFCFLFFSLQKTKSCVGATMLPCL